MLLKCVMPGVDYGANSTKSIELPQECCNENSNRDRQGFHALRLGCYGNDDGGFAFHPCQEMVIKLPKSFIIQ
jgi:hypothetical protein